MTITLVELVDGALEAEARAAWCVACVLWEAAAVEARRHVVEHGPEHEDTCLHRAADAYLKKMAAY